MCTNQSGVDGNATHNPLDMNSPSSRHHCASCKKANGTVRDCKKPTEGFEPPTSRLLSGCSAN